MKELNKYKLLTFIRYLGDGLFYPFFTLYLKASGILEMRIGLLLSLSPLLSIICNPIFSKICKNPKITKDVLMWITILEGLIILFIPFNTNFYLLLILTILLGIFGSCHYGLLDALSTIYADTNLVNYSAIRVFGSGAYIIATSVGGIICEYSFKWCFILCTILFIITGLIYHIIMPIIGLKNENNYLNNNINNNIKEETPSVLRVIKNKNFILILILHMALQGITKSADNFFPTYLESRGVSSTTYGFVYSYFVIAEVIALIIFNKKLKLNNNPYFYFFISSLLLMIRLLVNYLYLPISIVIFVSAFRGIGYAIVLHLMYQYITKLVKGVDATLAIMLNTLVYSIFLFIFSNYYGKLIENVSYQTFYLINTILACFVCLYSILIYFIKRKKMV